MSLIEKIRKLFGWDFQFPEEALYAEAAKRAEAAEGKAAEIAAAAEIIGIIKKAISDASATLANRAVTNIDLIALYASHSRGLSVIAECLSVAESQAAMVHAAQATVLSLGDSVKHRRRVARKQRRKIERLAKLVRSISQRIFSDFRREAKNSRKIQAKERQLDFLLHAQMGNFVCDYLEISSEIQTASDLLNDTESNVDRLMRELARNVHGIIKSNKKLFFAAPVLSRKSFFGKFKSSSEDTIEAGVIRIIQFRDACAYLTKFLADLINKINRLVNSPVTVIVQTLLTGQLESIGSTARLDEAINFLRSTDAHLFDLQNEEKAAKAKRSAEASALKKKIAATKDARQAKRLAQTAQGADKAFQEISINWEREWNWHMENVETEMEQVNKVIGDESKLSGERIFKDLKSKSKSLAKLVSRKIENIAVDPLPHFSSLFCPCFEVACAFPIFRVAAQDGNFFRRGQVLQILFEAPTLPAVARTEDGECGLVSAYTLSGRSSGFASSVTLDLADCTAIVTPKFGGSPGSKENRRRVRWSDN